MLEWLTLKTNTQQELPGTFYSLVTRIVSIHPRISSYQGPKLPMIHIRGLAREPDQTLSNSEVYLLLFCHYT